LLQGAGGIRRRFRSHPGALTFEIAAPASDKSGNRGYQDKSNDDKCRKNRQESPGIPGPEEIDARCERDKPARVHDGNVFAEDLAKIAAFFSLKIPCRDDAVSAGAGSRAEMLAVPADKAPEQDYGEQIVQRHEDCQRGPHHPRKHRAQNKHGRSGDVVEQDQPHRDNTFACVCNAAIGNFILHCRSPRKLR